MIPNLAAPLTHDELDQFEEFLATLPEEAMMLEEVHGFLTAVLTAPTPLGFSDWQPLIFGGEEPAFESMEEANEIIGLLMRLYNQTASELQAGKLVPLGHPDPESLELWCSGYVEAMELDEAWLDDEIGAALAIPMGILSGELELVGHEDSDGNEITDPTHHEELARSKLVESVREVYGHFAEARMPAAPVARTAQKIGRNEPCPCGSGKKYKKCCLA